MCIIFFLLLAVCILIPIRQGKLGHLFRRHRRAAPFRRLQALPGHLEYHKESPHPLTEAFTESTVPLARRPSMSALPVESYCLGNLLGPSRGLPVAEEAGHHALEKAPSPLERDPDHFLL